MNKLISIPTCNDQTALLWLREDGVIDAQLCLRFRGNKILRGGKRLGHIHHHGDGRRGRVLCQEECKNVAEDVALWLVSFSFGQEGKIPGTERAKISLKFRTMLRLFFDFLSERRGGV